MADNRKQDDERISDEAEQNCFDLVKQKLNNDIYFGMSIEDSEVIMKAFSEAEANYESKLFPDFIFDDGFIEHFRVTSSFEKKKKGSIMEIEKSAISREFQNKAKVVQSATEDRKSVV